MSHQDTSTHHHHHFMPPTATTTTTTAAAATIDSFSQLPFIRTASSCHNQPNYNTPSTTTGASLRLFGFDFPSESSTNPTGLPHQEDLLHKDNSLVNVKDTKSDNNASVSSASTENGANRKFECHYCCRNFPTSQALGGHQNAHKRERQQAKRAQFQTSMTTDGPMYSPFSYYRLGSIPSVGRFESTEVPPHYPSWVHGTSNLSTPGPRFYGGLGFVSEPINGNPVSGSWRLPVQGVFGGFSSVHHDRPMPLPLLAETNPKSAVVSSSFFPTAAAAASNSLVVQDHERVVKDGVSLDLHL